MLRKTLAKKGWSGKEALYTTLFDSVEYLREADDPDISIIVISWRRHRDTLRNLSLLQRQRCHNFELVFVNNGAEESDFDDLKSNIDTYISLNRNTGAYLARNVGAAFAKAPILLFLEDDGIPEEKFVEAHLSAHRRDEVIAVRGVYLPKTDKPLNSLALHYFLGPRSFPFHVNLEGNASYRSDCFYRVGGWDDRIHYGYGGLELFLRLRRFETNGCRQIYSPEPVIYHDYAADLEHLQRKTKIQEKSRERIFASYPELPEVLKEYRLPHELAVSQGEHRQSTAPAYPEWMSDTQKILLDRISSRADPRLFGFYQYYLDQVTGTKTNKASDISVIVEVPRLSSATRECLEALSMQEDVNSEIVLVAPAGQINDIDSFDGLYDVLVAARGNPGPSTVLNLGAFFASAPVLMFLHGDLLPGKGLLRSHVEARELYDTCAVLGPVLDRNSNSPDDPSDIKPHYMQCPIGPGMNLYNNSYESKSFFEVRGLDPLVSPRQTAVDMAIRLYQHVPDISNQVWAAGAIVYRRQRSLPTASAGRNPAAESSWRMIEKKFPFFDHLLEHFNRIVEDGRPLTIEKSSAAQALLTAFGQGLWPSNDTERTIEILRQAAALLPKNAGVRSLLGCLLLLRGDVDEALMTSAQAHELNFFSPFTVLVHALTLAEAGRADEAREACTRFLARFQHPDVERLSVLLRDSDMKTWSSLSRVDLQPESQRDPDGECSLQDHLHALIRTHLEMLEQFDTHDPGHEKVSTS